MSIEFTDLRSDIVLELRSRYLQRCSIPELIHLIQERLGLTESQRDIVLWYLGGTFNVPLPSLLSIGGWRGFTDGFLTDEDVDAILRPAIEAAESDWMPDKK